MRKRERITRCLAQPERDPQADTASTLKDTLHLRTDGSQVGWHNNKQHIISLEDVLFARQCPLASVDGRIHNNKVIAAQASAKQPTIAEATTQSAHLRLVDQRGHAPGDVIRS